MYRPLVEFWVIVREHLIDLLRVDTERLGDIEGTDAVDSVRQSVDRIRRLLDAGDDGLGAKLADRLGQILAILVLPEQPRKGASEIVQALGEALADIAISPQPVPRSLNEAPMT